MAITTLHGPHDIHQSLGKHLGYSEWMEITQDRVNLFADATGDHQWIHVDPERASSGPFGAPIAHGYLTLSISNYGTDKVRFPSPVKVGSRVRGGAELTAVTEVKGGLQTTIVITIEIEGSTKPACVIESISRWLTS